MDSFDNHAVDESESTQHSCTDSQTMSTETSDKTFNKNIEDLKKLDIPNNFESVFAKYDVYSIFNRIAKENDFDALNFAAKEGFLDVIYSKNCDIFLIFSQQTEFKVVLLIMEFKRNCNVN